MDTHSLFAPKDIIGHNVKNRLAVAPMTRITATADGRATETMARYYERFARGEIDADDYTQRRDLLNGQS